MLNSIVKQLESINNAQFVVQNFKSFAVEQPGTPFYREVAPLPDPPHTLPSPDSHPALATAARMLAGISTPSSLHLQHA